MKKLNPAISVIGVNAGLGVALFPFRKNLKVNIEVRSIFHTPNDEQWRGNFPNVPLHRSFKRDLVGDLDILITSPDCGSGSVLRLSRAKKLGDHNENVSLIISLGAIRIYKPKIFLFENLDSMFKSLDEEGFIKKLSNYRIIKHNVSVSQFGNSQKSRKRLVIIGIRKDLPKKVDKYFKLPNFQDKVKVCNDLYGDLGHWDPGICHISEDTSTAISIHARRKLTPMQIAEEWNGRLKGKKRWESPGYSFSTAPGVYRNLDFDYPSTARKSNRQFDECGNMLSPRQLARIMGIPDTFKLHFDMKRRNYWINKGRTCVTKGMVYEVPKWFKRCLIKSQKIWKI